MKKSVAIIIIVIVAIIFIAAGIWVGLTLSGNRAGGTTLSPYSAVYLSTGDIYFGTLDWFPTPHIKDAWFLQRGTDAKGNPTEGVYPFGQIAWGPAGDVYLNAKQIIFWTRLSSTSSIVQAMENPSTAASAQQESAAAQIPVPTTSSTAQ